jgi:Cyclin-dependent kinase inhibitor 3 (CDKN3)
MEPTIYWIDNSGESRLAILARPQGNDALGSEIQGWREAGIDVVVSMLTETDNLYLGLSPEAELCRSNGLHFISFPIEDCGVPDSFDATLRLVRELNDLLMSGKSIGFHCQGCVGRSPLIASCVLMFSGMSAESAFELVRDARGCPILEGTQAEWGRNFARLLSSFVHH